MGTWARSASSRAVCFCANMRMVSAPGEGAWREVRARARGAGAPGWRARAPHALAHPPTHTAAAGARTGGGADEGDAGILAGLAELGVLRKEAVAGEHGVAAWQRREGEGGRSDGRPACVWAWHGSEGLRAAPRARRVHRACTPARRRGPACHAAKEGAPVSLATSSRRSALRYSLGEAPRHTLSDACSTCRLSASGSVKTATQPMPRRLHARCARHEISPRLATSTLVMLEGCAMVWCAWVPLLVVLLLLRRSLLPAGARLQPQLPPLMLVSGRGGARWVAGGCGLQARGKRLWLVGCVALWHHVRRAGSKATGGSRRRRRRWRRGRWFLCWPLGAWALLPRSPHATRRL